MSSKKNLEDLTDRELLEELVRLQRKDSFHEKLSAIANVMLMLVILGVCLVLVPRTMSTLKNVDKLVQDTNAVVIQADEAVQDINEIVDDLSAIVKENNEALNTTIQNASQINIDKLNESIDQFSKVVEPLSRMFSIIGR